jgi:hypothetical protein
MKRVDGAVYNPIPKKTRPGGGLHWESNRIAPHEFVLQNGLPILKLP